MNATVERLAETTRDFAAFVAKLEEIFPKLETDTTIRAKLNDVPALPREPSPQQVLPPPVDKTRRLAFSDAESSLVNAKTCLKIANF